MSDSTSKNEPIIAADVRPYQNPRLGCMAHCGNCGQRLWQVENHARLIAGVVDGAAGWRYDGEVWRPTPHHQAQRRRAEARLQDIARETKLRGASVATTVARTSDRWRLQHNRFQRDGGYSNRPDRPHDAVIVHDWGRPDIAAALRLPALIHCPRCHDVNRVSPRPDL